MPVHYGDFLFAVSPEGRRPEGSYRLETLIRDKVLADMQFLTVLLDGYQPGAQLEVCLSLIHPVIHDITAKIEYGLELHRGEYPDPKRVKAGHHFPSLEAADEFIESDVKKDAAYIVAVWNYLVDVLLPQLKPHVKNQLLSNSDLIEDIQYAEQIAIRKVVWSISS